CLSRLIVRRVTVVFSLPSPWRGLSDSQLAAPGTLCRSFRLLSGLVCCRAAGDSLDASTGPFEREPMHRRKQHGHGFGKACASTIDAEGAPPADLHEPDPP